MPSYFFDSSAIVKRYVTEIGTDWVREILAPKPGKRIYIARITVVEVIAAIFRRMKTGSLTTEDALKAKAQFEQDLPEFRIVEVGAQTLQAAIHVIVKHQLRAYDSIQFGAAAVVKAYRDAKKKTTPLVFVASDQVLLTVAKLEGMAVEDPQAHP